MKKRILALALAGTTAFSVFGALNVAAATHKTDASEIYSGMYKFYDARKGFEGAADFELVVEFDEAMDTIVEDNVIYLYDFFEVFSDAGYEVEDFESDEKTPDEVFGELVPSKEANPYEFGDGDRRSFRADLIDAWDEFIADLSLEVADYDYKDADGSDPYNFEGLMADINKVEAYKDGAAGYLSSQLVYLMQEYARFIDSEYATLVEVDNTDWADLLVAILEGRDEEDFKYTKEYRGWTADLEDLIEAYEDAETRSELNKAVAALEKEVTDKADDTVIKSDLADLKAALVVDIEIDGKTWPLYPAADYLQKNGKYTAEFIWADKVYDLAATMFANGNKENYQGSVDVITDALVDALEALETVTEPKASRLLSLEEWVDTYAGLNEIDYTKKAWGWYTKALDRAEDLLAGDPGREQVADAVEMLHLVGDIMEDCDYHIAPKKSQIRELDAAIKEANAWLKEYDETAAVSKVLAVTKALKKAESVKADYNDKEECVLLSEILGAIDGIDAALSSTAVANGWLKTEDGWMYGTETGYATGWAKIGAVYYFFDENGIANESEWMYENGKWYYFTEGCNAVANHWALVDGKWYWFNEDYSMFANGWKWINNKCYYFYADGSMAANTTIDGYVVGADGAWIA